MKEFVWGEKFQVFIFSSSQGLRVLCKFYRSIEPAIDLNILAYIHTCLFVTILNQKFKAFFFSIKKSLLEVIYQEITRWREIFRWISYFLVPFRIKRQFLKKNTPKKVSSHLTFIHHVLITLIPFLLFSIVIVMLFMAFFLLPRCTLLPFIVYL